LSRTLAERSEEFDETRFMGRLRSAVADFFAGDAGNRSVRL